MKFLGRGLRGLQVIIVFIVGNKKHPMGAGHMGLRKGTKVFLLFIWLWLLPGQRRVADCVRDALTQSTRRGKHTRLEARSETQIVGPASAYCYRFRRNTALLAEAWLPPGTLILLDRL